MSKYPAEIKFPITNPPKDLEVIRVRENIYWARMRIPEPLNHVNVYIAVDRDDLTIIDTGMSTKENKLRWKNLLNMHFKDKSVSRVIVTHHHPDHYGLAGWFSKEFDSQIISSRTSYLMARMLTLDVQNNISAEAKLFYLRAGMPNDMLEKRTKIRPMNFSDFVHTIPLGFKRIQNNEKIKIAGENWKIIFGNGHAPSHATFFSKESNIVIVGDQVLPGISSNLGVYATEPEADTVGDWITSCRKLKRLANNEQLVLPGHRLPFTGLSIRLEQLIRNHTAALKRIERKLGQGSFKTVDLFKTIFMREIKESEFGLALSEAAGHMNHLYLKGKISRKLNNDGAYLWTKIQGNA